MVMVVRWFWRQNWRHVEQRVSPGGLNPGLFWWRWGRVEPAVASSSVFAEVRDYPIFRAFSC